MKDRTQESKYPNHQVVWEGWTKFHIDPENLGLWNSKLRTSSGYNPQTGTLSLVVRNPLDDLGRTQITMEIRIPKVADAYCGSMLALNPKWSVAANDQEAAEQAVRALNELPSVYLRIWGGRPYVEEMRRGRQSAWGYHWPRDNYDFFLEVAPTAELFGEPQPAEFFLYMSKNTCPYHEDREFEWSSHALYGDFFIVKDWMVVLQDIGGIYRTDVRVFVPGLGYLVTVGKFGGPDRSTIRDNAIKEVLERLEHMQPQGLLFQVAGNEAV